MRVGLIDVDMESRGKCTYPNLALMKLSAWHKAKGDHVEWYKPMASGHMDIVYCSKVFGDEYTHDYQYNIDADKIVKGGSGYAISVVDGLQVYDKSKDPSLPDEIEHTFPDYGIYEQFGIKDTAFGFLTRGCPRNCAFCHVAAMQSTCTHTVARLSEFWNGQKYISLLDPNLTASRDYEMHMTDLANSQARVDFSQGLDARMMTPQRVQMLNKVRWKSIHFAWDNPNDNLRDKFLMIRDNLRACSKSTVSCYCLTNFNGSTLEDAKQRVYFLRSLNIQPYVMIYRKGTAPIELRKFARWVNNPFIFWTVPTFEDYDASVKYKKTKK